MAKDDPSAKAEVSWTVKPVSISPFTNLASLWTHWEVFTFLVLHCVRSVYGAAILGMGWLFIRPMIMAAMATIVLNRMLGLSTDPIPYLLYVMIGMSIWILLQRGATWATRSFMHHGKLVNRFGFPPFVIHVASLAPGMVESGIVLTAAAGIAIFFEVTGTPTHLAFGMNTLYLPVAWFAVVLLVLGVSCVTTVLNKVARDTWYVMRYVLQAWVAVTPVYYPIGEVPEAYREWMWLNPMTPVVELFRYALFAGEPVPTDHLISGGVVIFLVFCGGLWFFSVFAPRSLEHR